VTAGQPAEPAAVAGGSPLLEAIVRLGAEFDEALARRDANAAVRCALSLEEELHAWSSDTLQSDEADRGRATLRGMLVRLGEAAQEGVRDPRAVVAPWVDALLALRASARAAKRWNEADEVRDHLLALGVEVRDDPSGTTWDFDGVRPG